MIKLVNGHTLVADSGESVALSRLIMVAEEGIETVKHKHVHHRNGIPWDDRPSNLELMEPGEHSRLHGINRQKWPGQEDRTVEEHREIRKRYLNA